LAGVSHGAMSVSTDEHSVSMDMPRQQYVSGAFPTEAGIPSNIIYPTAAFGSVQSRFAYISGQSYAENIIAPSN
jgi:hypothetical protein